MKKQVLMPRSSFEHVTVDKAKAYLEKNLHNRPMNMNHVDQLVYEMSKNNFHLTGESIKFSEDGTLLDGQHRLMAIIKSKKPQDLLIIRNLDNEAFKYMDTNKPRNAADVLGIEGIKNPNRVAAVVKFIINFENSRFSDASNSVTRGKQKITNSIVADYVDKHIQQLEDSIPYGYAKGNKFISSSSLAGLHYVFNKINTKDADEFCHRLVEGTELRKDSPIWLLRQRLIADVRSTKKMKVIMKIALTCKAWNHYRNKKTVSNIVWDSMKEPFPKPI